MTISSEIINVLNALCEKFGIAIDWTATNVIPYFQDLLGRYITYEIATSIAWISIMGLILIICLIGLKISYSKAKAIKWDDEYVSPFLFFGFLTASILFGIIFLFVLGKQVFDIITCMTFPEKIIYDEISYLLRNSHI